MLRIAYMVLILCLVGSSAGCRYAERSRSRDAAMRELHDPSADARRRAINWFAGSPIGHDAQYIIHFRQLAAGDPEAGIEPDPEPTVRAAAVRALNRLRNRGSTPEFNAALNDQHHLVRLEAAKALNNLPDPQAVRRLIQRLMDPQEDKDVRIAAAEALHRYRRRDAADALINSLDERHFGVVWQSHRSLRAMTRRDFGYNQQAWREHVAVALADPSARPEPGP